MAKATMTSKGQVTIPKAVRERLGLRTGDRLEFEPTRNGGILVRRVNSHGDAGSLAGYLDDRVDVVPTATLDEIAIAREAAVADHVLSTLQDEASDGAA